MNRIHMRPRSIKKNRAKEIDCWGQHSSVKMEMRATHKYRGTRCHAMRHERARPWLYNVHSPLSA